MRTLKYAILGLVNRKSMTGYDIAKEFNEELANFWYAKHSQIYPELKKLVEDNLVEFSIVISGEVLEKKLYKITEKGRQELQNWLIKDEELEPTPKDKFRLRMYFSENMSEEQLVCHLKSQLTKRKLKLTFLEERLLQYEKVPSIDTPKFGDFIILQGAVMRENTCIQWLEQCLGYINKEADLS